MLKNTKMPNGNLLNLNWAYTHETSCPQTNRQAKAEGKFPSEIFLVIKFFTALSKPHIVFSVYKNSDYRLYGSR